jgi:hypothetical protein
MSAGRKSVVVVERERVWRTVALSGRKYLNLSCCLPQNLDYSVPACRQTTVLLFLIFD